MRSADSEGRPTSMRTTAYGSLSVYDSAQDDGDDGAGNDRRRPVDGDEFVSDDGDRDDDRDRSAYRSLFFISSLPPQGVARFVLLRVGRGGGRI
jgi:hypothetical protein